jgi:hypothetical protein
MMMPKNKEGLLLHYLETCGRIVPTYQEPALLQGVATDSRPNPNSTAGTQKNFAAAALEDGPTALAPALASAPGFGTEADITHYIGTAAETQYGTAAIFALDPAARTSRPKYDTEDDTQLPPALTCATAAPAWDDDDTPLGLADDSLYGRPVPMDETIENVHLPLFEVESEVESSDEESVFDLMGL